MKKLITTLFVMTLILGSVHARKKEVTNPAYEVRKSGLYEIDKIELGKDETRIHLHVSFIKGWWVNFDGDEFIRDVESGDKFTITGIEGAEFKKKLHMPASGDTTVVLKFPALDKHVEKIDYVDLILGVALDGTQQSEKNVVPDEVASWLKDELEQGGKKQPIDLKSSDFFSNDTARLVGYIKGYDKRLGFSTGIVYLGNDLTRDDYPTVVTIHEDGRFEADLPLIHPIYSHFFIKRNWIPFYLEPGQTLSMILDWDEFLIADRRRNIRYRFKDIEYQGALGQTNKELLAFKVQDYDYKKYKKQAETLSPEEFTAEFANYKAEQLGRLAEYNQEHEVSEKASTILRNNIILTCGTRMFDFVNARSRALRSKDPKKLVGKIGPDYYDFLKDIPMNEASLLVSSNFSSFVNRFEYCNPLSRLRRNTFVKPEKSFFEYLMEEKVPLSDDFKKLLPLFSKPEKTDAEDKFISEKRDAWKEWIKQNNEHVTKYRDKYIKSSGGATKKCTAVEEWNKKDSVMQQLTGDKLNLVYQVAKIRSLNFSFKFYGKDQSEELWSNLQRNITNPYLIETGSQLYENVFSEEASLAYELPKGHAADVFKKIIDPYKGKVLFVDFWATTCGPCVGGIKRMKANREKYAGNENFDFVFITDEGGSPKGAYNKFVEEQGLKNSYRLTKDEYNYLRQLFHFNGIPRYVVIDKEGKVLDDDFSMHSFDHLLDGILAKAK
ncbi:TlpA family protein disulfide reductase [Puteibacter caeruleilacunae]|nr:TlpA family protein disulfide reductase [Puteibacter caeruleilacunae]